MSEKLLLVINPVSGRGKGKSKLFEIVNGFSQHGYEVTVLPTKPDVSADIQVMGIVKNFDLVVAVGGDGTLNQVAAGILKSGEKVPLGYIPLGSTNDFAASLGLNGSIADCVKRICCGKAAPIDVGKFNDEYFVYIACTGVFANTSFETSRQMKNMLGHSAYIIKGLANMSLSQSADFLLKTDSETIEGSYIFVSFSNATIAGGFVKMPPNEVLFDDGLFELTLAPAPKGFAEGTALVTDVLSSGFASSKLIRRKVRKCVLTCTDPQSWSLDGENGGMRQTVTIEVLEKALLFVR